MSNIIVPGPNNELIIKPYSSPTQLPIPGEFIFVNTENDRLSLDTRELNGIGVVQFQPSASLYTLHEGYWYLIGSGEGAVPTYYASDIINDSTISGSTVQASLTFISSSLFSLNVSASRYIIDSSSFSSRITKEEATSSLLINTSASLQRYNVDSSSFNSNIANKINITNPSSTGSFSHSGSFSGTGSFSVFGNFQYRQGLSTSPETISTPRILTSTSSIILASPNMRNFTLTLPTASLNVGRLYEIKNIGTSSIYVSGSAASLIDGFSPVEIPAFSSYGILSDGTNWNIV